MKGRINLDKKVRAIDVESNRSISDLLKIMENTGFQGKNLAKVVTVLEHMSKDPNITILFGYAGSLSTTGQWKIINWFLENNLIDILVPSPPLLDIMPRGAPITIKIIHANGIENFLCNSTRYEFIDF